MKAASPVMVQTQRQMTLLGLPMALMATVSTAATVAAAVAGLALSIALMVPAGVGCFAAVWLFLFRCVREDPHVDRELVVAARFWRGRRERHLAAGGRA